MKVSSRFLMLIVTLALAMVVGVTWAFAQTEAPGLAGLTCASGQIAMFDGTAWACADDLAEMQARLDALALKVDPEAQFIETVNAVEEAVKANDLDRLMEFYADDVVTILPGMPPLVGKEAVRDDWAYFFDTFTLERDAELVYVNVDGDSAVRRMAWTNTLTPKDGSDAIIDTGNCVVGFKKVGGEWKIAWEMAATYTPEP